MCMVGGAHGLAKIKHAGQIAYQTSSAVKGTGVWCLQSSLCPM